MQSMLTDQRRDRMLHAANNRTRYLRLVVQDVHDPHNVSACLRSAEAFGIQEIDVVTLRETFRASTVARGVNHWLSIRKHKTVKGCADGLRQAGFRIVAGVPKPGAKHLDELPLDKPLAVVFGNEHQGIDPEWHEHIDEPFTIPMVGMVESLNISVSAAIALHQLTKSARAKLPPETYFLKENERNALLSSWICRQIPAWPDICARLRGESGGR
jgi:tRNA (guanosine-2'-O-)-methyltransferase